MRTIWSTSSRHETRNCSGSLIGLTYKNLEDQGFLLVVTKVEIRYKSPARYDDVLTICTTVERTTAVRIDHRYEVFCEGRLVAEASSTLACVNREGRPQALPELLRDH